MEPWQADYDRELRRTAGYGASFRRMRGGGWWNIAYGGGGTFGSRSARKSQVEQWTANLRRRPDYAGRSNG